MFMFQVRKDYTKYLVVLCICIHTYIHTHSHIYTHYLSSSLSTWELCFPKASSCLALGYSPAKLWRTFQSNTLSQTQTYLVGSNCPHSSCCPSVCAASTKVPSSRGGSYTQRHHHRPRFVAGHGEMSRMSPRAPTSLPTPALQESWLVPLDCCSDSPFLTFPSQPPPQPGKLWFLQSNPYSVTFTATVLPWLNPGTMYVRAYIKCLKRRNPFLFVYANC